MTTLHDLTIRTAAKTGITDEAAEAALTTYIGQLEALEQRNIDADDINDDDADFLHESVIQAQRAGDMGQRELAALEEVAGDMERAQATLDDVEQQRNKAIRDALDAGARIKDIAAAAGLTRQRIEQIRNQ